MTVFNGFGNYAAGSAKLEKRFSKGMQFLTAYTWSHAGERRHTAQRIQQDGLTGSDQLGSGYSSASWDIRHSFTSGFIYDIPFGKGNRIGQQYGSASR